VVEVASEIGCTPGQVALRWMMERPGTVVPLLGARKVEQLRDNLGALEVLLTPEQSARLDEASDVPKGFPHDFLGKEEIQDIVYGGTQDRIDFPHREIMP